MKDHDPEPRLFATPDTRMNEQWGTCAFCDSPIVRRLVRLRSDGEATWSGWRHA